MIMYLIGQFEKWQVTCERGVVMFSLSNHVGIYIARKEAGGEPRDAHGPTFV